MCAQMLSHILSLMGFVKVYWLPTITEEYKASDVPQHPGLRLLANAPQTFNKWTRRLLTMEKIRPGDVELPSLDYDRSAERQFGHTDFRAKYMRPATVATATGTGV